MISIKLRAPNAHKVYANAYSQFYPAKWNDDKSPFAAKKNNVPNAIKDNTYSEITVQTNILPHHFIIYIINILSL